MLIGIQNTMKELEKREVILKLDNEKLKSEVEVVYIENFSSGYNLEVA